MPDRLTFIALLRAVNVTGYNRIGMSDLRRWATDLGFANARTVLQSGNLVFDAKGGSADSLERRFDREVERSLGVRTEFFVRSALEWEALIAANPFRAEAMGDPAHLVVVFLKSAPTGARLEALRAAVKGRERVAIAGKQAYIVYPDGIGPSKLTNQVIEKQLGSRGTARNWNTVLKLRALAGGR